MLIMPPVFNSGDTIYFYFDTYDRNGASITITGLAVTDIEVYKNGSVTQRSSDSGYALLDTDGIDFDGTTGLHGFSIDTSDNTDAGFWADGAQYLVNVNAITVDSQTVRFSYMLTLGYLLRPTTAGRKLDVSTGGEAGVDWANVGSPTSTVGLTNTTVGIITTYTGNTVQTGDAFARLGAPAGASVSADVAGVQSDTNDIQTRLPAALSAAGNMKADMLEISSDSTAADNLEADFDGTGYALYLRRNTAQAGAASNITLDASASATTDLYKGLIIELTGGTGAGQARLISAYNGTTKVASILPNWDTTPDATTVFQLHPNARVDVARWVGSSVNALVSGNVPADMVSISGDSVASDNLESALDGTGGVTITANITGNVTGNLSGSVGSVTGAVGSVTGAVGSIAAGGITAASFGAGAIDAAAIAADAIGSSELAASAVSEIWTTALTESYAADGAAPTPAQALFLIQQVLTEFAISGTTITIKKLDGAATAATLTIDSATAPTSATRAT